MVIIDKLILICSIVRTLIVKTSFYQSIVYWYFGINILVKTCPSSRVCACDFFTEVLHGPCFGSPEKMLTDKFCFYRGFPHALGLYLYQ